jgi:RIO kinase 1
LFRKVLHNIELMLQRDLVHGDLSAYNVLYWEGEITLIDFPQVVDLHTNRKARFILQRDIQRTSEYFARQGVPCRPRAIMNDFWRRHVVQPDPADLAADWSRVEESLADRYLLEEVG